jgi:hypothetical protein
MDRQSLLALPALNGTDAAAEECRYFLPRVEPAHAKLV